MAENTVNKQRDVLNPRGDQSTPKKQYNDRNPRGGNRPSFAPLEWVEAKRFEHQGLVVAVRKAKRNGQLVFSTFMGTVRKDGSLSPNVNIEQVNDPSKVVLRFNYAEVYSGLLAQAQEYIQTQLEEDWAYNLDARIAREEKRFDGDKKQVQTYRQGKTARDRNKRGPKGAE